MIQGAAQLKNEFIHSLSLEIWNFAIANTFKISTPLTVLELRLPRINKDFLYKTQKHYNYLQLIKIRNYIQKILKMRGN